MDTIKLSNSVRIPHIGLGTYPMSGTILTSTVESAYDAGYRLIDTADNYYNEEDLGRSLQSLYEKTDAQREDLFLVSKISDELYRPSSPGGGLNKGVYFWKKSPVMQTENAVRKVVRKKIHDTLRFLGTDYLDLYLMHWPYPDYLEDIWYEMEELYLAGTVRAIGVCNCRERHLEKLLAGCRTAPMVNQFETSPINTKQSIIEYCDTHDIRVMVYSPLMSLRTAGFSEYRSLLQRLATKYNCSEAQIILRFDVQRGLIPIPKSATPARLHANIDLDTFCLTPEEMAELAECNVDYQYLPESRSCPGL